MPELDPRTPVLVGIGLVQQKCEDPLQAREAIDLMIDAVRQAGADAGIADHMSEIDSVLVPQGLWSYGDPGRMIADHFGATKARTVYAKLGVMQQSLLNEACRGIAQGEIDLAVVAGGEAKYREAKAMLAGVEVAETANDGAPDVVMEPDEELYHPLEVEALSHMPVGYYALMQSAFRAAKGRSVDEDRDRLAQLYSRFSEIAADNPHAWKREALAPESIRNGSPQNKMLAFPYTKLHNSSWNVDQASAMVFCSVEKAQALSIPREKWIFPRSSAESNYMLSVAQRPQLDSLPSARLSGQKALEIAGLGVEDIDFIELYSCFPIAVEFYADAIGVPEGKDLTVAGGMPFAGGPLNNYVYQSTCRMAECLRTSPGSHGIVSSVSGLMTKQSFAVWSTEPGGNGFGFADVTEEVRALWPAVEIIENYRGEGRILGYTIIYRGGEPSRAVAMLEVPGGHTLGWNEEATVMQAMEQSEHCGVTVKLADNLFTPVENAQ